MSETMITPLNREAGTKTKPLDREAGTRTKEAKRAAKALRREAEAKAEQIRCEAEVKEAERAAKDDKLLYRGARDLITSGIKRDKTMTKLTIHATVHGLNTILKKRYGIRSSVHTVMVERDSAE